MSKAGHIGAITAMILRMASGQDGTTLCALSEALNTTTNRASARMGDLRKRGRMFSAKVKGSAVHYFTTQEAASEWRRRQLRPVASASPSWPLSLPGTPKSIKPAPHMKARPAEAIAALSKGWTHDPRFQCGPGEFVPAIFSSMPIGTYLEA